jgi:hypothetical protein
MSNVILARSTDFGAPVLYGNAGYLIPVLDAVLIDGYGLQNVLSITHLNGTVTVTTASAHGLSSYARQQISGVNESGYNGVFEIIVPNTTQFTYQASGITVNTGTGTVTTKTPGAGWSKPFSATNTAVYRPGSGLRHYFKVVDTTTICARFWGHVSMSDVNTGTDQFPTSVQMSGGLYWQKSTTADATNAKGWIIVADDKTMIMFIWFGAQGSVNYNNMCSVGMGEFATDKTGELYNSFVSGALASNSYSQMPFNILYNNIGAVLTTSQSAMYAPRSYTQVGTSVILGKIGDYSKSSQSGMGCGGSLPYPHPVKGGMLICDVGIAEGGAVAAASVLRGRMRGIMNPLHDNPCAHGDIFDGNGDTAGRRFLAICSCSGSSTLSQYFMDITMSWDGLW